MEKAINVSKTEKRGGVNETVEQAPVQKINRTWEAAMRLKGSLIVNDPKFLL